jgi:hypothetical protein
MNGATMVRERKRTADFNKIREHGIYCSKDVQTAIISLPNERRVFISIDKRRQDPCLRFYTAAQELQW